MQKKTAQKTTDKSLLNQINTGFFLMGTSLSEYCEQNSIDRRNAYRALIGEWKGKKGKTLRDRILRDSKPNFTHTGMQS